MELSVSGVGPSIAATQRRPDTGQGQERARAAPEEKAEPVSNTVVVSWFDRNGDGRIDGTDWLAGGDAFLTVGKDVAPVLQHGRSQDAGPAGPPPSRGPVTGSRPAASAAAAAYQHYGAAAGSSSGTGGVPNGGAR